MLTGYAASNATVLKAAYEERAKRQRHITEVYFRTVRPYTDTRTVQS